MSQHRRHSHNRRNAGRVAVYLSQKSDTAELTSVTQSMRDAAHTVLAVAEKPGMLTLGDERHGELNFAVDATARKDLPARCAGLCLPSGVWATEADAIDTVKAFLKAGKPILAMSDGVDVLYSAAGEDLPANVSAAVSVNGKIYPGSTASQNMQAMEVFTDMLAQPEAA